jgi:hypothetical protein
MENPEVLAGFCVLKEGLFIQDPLLNWSPTLLGHSYAHRCQQKIGSYIQSSGNRSFMQSASDLWFMHSRRNTEGNIWQKFL